MILLDANLLLYAFRREFSEHEAAKRWMDKASAAGEVFVVHPLVGAAFLRLSTRKLGPMPPAPMAAALDFLSVLLVAGMRLPEAENHGQVLSRLCARHGIQGDGVVDAWLAAFAITQ